MTRTPVLALVFACITLSCTTVPAALTELRPEAPPAPAPTVNHENAPAPMETPKVAVEDQLRKLDASGIFDGEVELQVPNNLLALQPFGSSHVGFEFEQSQAKIEGQRKLPGAWEGQLIRWVRRDPSTPEPNPLQQAIAHRPSWSLAPAGCDDANDQCYVREASKQWLEHSHDERQGWAQGLLEIGGSPDEAGPTRYMLVTTVVRGSYAYGLLYELHADEWLANEELLRASSASFSIK